MSDPSPSAEVLLEHRAFVRAIARGLLGDEHAAEDVAQESLLAGLHRPPRGPNVRAWLGAVARNLALMARRAEARRQRREERAARPEALPSTAEAVARLDLQRKIVEAVLALDEPYRTTVVQRFFYDLTPGEIAERLGVPRETVRTRLRRALEQLRQRLDGEYGGDRRAWSLILVPMVLPAAGPRAAAGVVVMTTKAKLPIAAVAALLLTMTFFVGWRLLRDERGRRNGDRGPRHAADATASEQAVTPKLPAPIELARVDRERDLHGRVVSPAGEPVGGARLRVVSRPWERTNVLAEFAPELGSDTLSAADGSFRLPLRRGALVDLHVRAEGYADLTLARLQAGERVEVTLAHARRTVVRVEDFHGRPVAGATVLLARYAYEGGPRIERKRVTGRAGRVVFDGLPGGVTLRAIASHPDHGQPLGGHEFVAGDEFVLPLTEGRFFTGRVVDVETGAPIPNARVGMNWPLRPETKTDAAGRYRLNGWIKGTNIYHAIHVVAPRYPRVFARVTSETTYDFPLARGDLLTGRAVDAEGRPVAGARVAVIGDHDWALSIAHGGTDAAGRFRLGPLSRAMPHAVVILAAGHGRTRLGLRPREGEVGTIELGDVKLPRGRSIEGRAQDPAGRPLARVPVRLVGSHQAHGQLPPPRGVSHGDDEERLTDDLGRFRFPDLGPGSYRLTLQRRGGAPVERTVELGDEDQRDIVLTTPGGRPFTVIVEDDAGRPVPNADVVVHHESGPSYMRTGRDGRAVLTVRGAIEVAEVLSVAHGPDGTTPPFRGLPRVRDLPADASEIRLELERWDQVTGVVVDAAGKGVERACVVASWTDGSRTTFSNAQGAFRAAIPPGVEASFEVRGRRVADFSVVSDLTSESVRAAAGTRGLRLTARPVGRARSLRVKVVDPDDNPVPGARVSCRGADAETDASGVAHLSALPARELRIAAQAPGLAPPVPVAVVPSGQEITLRCRTGVTVPGGVFASDGAPAASARVVVVVGDEEFETTADERGRFELVVPAGPETIGLVAVAGNERGYVRQHRLDAGEPTLRLQPPNQGK
jgi:RNA polymerase sigma-70 factor (ECF subfamily)